MNVGTYSLLMQPARAWPWAHYVRMCLGTGDHALISMTGANAHANPRILGYRNVADATGLVLTAQYPGPFDKGLSVYQIGLHNL